MVGPYFKGFGVAFEVVAEGFEGSDNGKEFFIVDIIVLFRWLEGLGIIGDWVPAVEKVGLFQDSTDGEVASVRDEAERSRSFWEHKDRCNREGVD
jgi:hypothetical protein